MQRKYLVISWLLFVIFTILLGFAINFQIAGRSLFINEDIAMLLFCISFPLKIYNIKVGQNAFLIALLVLLFSPLSCSYTTIEDNISTVHSEAKFTSLISPLTLLVLFLFLIFNYKAVIDLYRLITIGSEKEQKEELSREIEFYYKKFNDCSNIELIDIYKMYNDYPVGAQIALKKINEEKGNN